MDGDQRRGGRLFVKNPRDRSRTVRVSGKGRSHSSDFSRQPVQAGVKEPEQEAEDADSRVDEGSVFCCCSRILDSGPFKFTYFGIEGAGEKVRLAFVLAGIEFEDVGIKFDEWQKLKPTTKYGQVPMLQIGDEEMAQSPAMMKYIALASGKLYPVSDPAKCVEIDEMMALCADFQAAWAPSIQIGMRPHKFGYAEDMEKDAKDAVLKSLRENFVKNDLPLFMGYFTKALEGKDFLCGDEPTLADCWALPLFRYFTKGIADYVPKDCLEPYPAIHAYINKMMAVPAIAKWYESKK